MHVCVHVCNMYLHFNLRKSCLYHFVVFLSGTVENTKQAHHYISQLAKGKEKNIRDVLPPSVVKRFNLDAATNQYSIASSLDSFDVDAVAPPASPGKKFLMLYLY